MGQSVVSRRGFIRAATAVSLTPYFFSETKTLADETVSANDRFRIGVIGCGGIARANMNAARPYCDIVAVCDVDRLHAEEMKKKFSGGRAKLYTDYRDLLARDDIDALHVATPDHWHAKPVVEALLAGHDVYCEKPLTLTVAEGKLVCDTQAKTGRVVQVGTQQRSSFDLFTKAIAIVKAGRLGIINRIETGIGAAPRSDSIPSAKPPKHLDWDRWLGPAPYSEYRMLPQPEKRRAFSNCHYEFRWWYQYSGGKLTDWGAHHVDIASWALEANGQSSQPISIGGTAEHPVPFKDGEPTIHDRYNTATKFDLRAELTDGVRLDIRSHGRNGVLIHGEKGRIFVNRKSLTGAPVEALKDDPLPESAMDDAYKGAPRERNGRQAHWANFFRSVRERTVPISDVHSHTRALNTCHLAGISARLGREIQWDAESEQIVDDETANRMLSRPYRSGYEIET